jgi:hypothetical protein
MEIVKIKRSTLKKEKRIGEKEELKADESKMEK